jgi:hypothetical protein
LDENTDETLLKLFDKDPGKEAKTAAFNHVTMPSRNWAIITENTPPSSVKIQSFDNPGDSSNANSSDKGPDDGKKHDYHVGLEECTRKDGHSPLHPGEVNAGTKNRAVTSHGKSHDGSLDVCIRVEKDRKDKDGHTEMYGMWIPPLKYDRAANETSGNADATTVAQYNTPRPS